MARINANDRLLEIKLVYYGPAAGGKTTNLEALHRIVDPENEIELISLDTHGDRTLFFDLLPMELGDVGGFRLKVRLFTVPGQVHYNATRRIVLRGSDGVVFVADSMRSRLEANGESVRSLHGNLVANDMKPGAVPLVFQANKRDREDAAPLDEVTQALALDSLADHRPAVLGDPQPASALTGDGVLETYDTVLKAALASVFRRYSLERLGLTRAVLGRAVDEALTPLKERRRRSGAVEAGGPAGTPPPPDGQDTIDESAAERTMSPDALLAEAVTQSIDLAEALGDQQAMRRELERRVRELEAIGDLGRSLTSTLEVPAIARAAVEAARAALPGGAASLLLPGRTGQLAAAATTATRDDPLLAAGGPELAATLARRGGTAHFADLDRDLAFGDADLLVGLSPFCTAGLATLRCLGERTGVLVAYGTDPDAPATSETELFLASIASGVELALQNAARHREILAHQARLEDEVAARTAELQLAHQELVATSGLKDRILSCVNHELRTPVTKLLAAAQVLERAKPGSSPPPSLLGGIVEQARHLARLLDHVLAARALLDPDGAGSRSPGSTASADVGRVLEAVAFSCQERAAARQVILEVDAPEFPIAACGESGSITLVLSQLVDNAVKFTRPGTRVTLSARQVPGGRVRVLVSDEGPGVRPEDVERIFGEFDQGSGDHLVAKPDGLGLGLAIARRLARRLQGDVGVGATEPGDQGATFWLELPPAPELAAATA